MAQGALSSNRRASGAPMATFSVPSFSETTAFSCKALPEVASGMEEEDAENFGEEEKAAESSGGEEDDDAESCGGEEGNAESSGEEDTESSSKVEEEDMESSGNEEEDAENSGVEEEDDDDDNDDDEDSESFVEEEDTETSEEEEEEDGSSGEEEEEDTETSDSEEDDDDDDEESSGEEEDTEISGEEEDDDGESSGEEEEDSEISDSEEETYGYEDECSDEEEDAETSEEEEEDSDDEISSKDCFEIPATRHSIYPGLEATASGPNDNKEPPAFSGRTNDDVDYSDEDESHHSYIDMIPCYRMCTHNAEQATAIKVQLQKQRLGSFPRSYDDIDTDSDIKEVGRSVSVSREYDGLMIAAWKKATTTRNMTRTMTLKIQTWKRVATRKITLMVAT